MDHGVWHGEDTDPTFPKGCYVSDNIHVYFNPTSTTGAAQDGSRPACIKQSDITFCFFKKE